MAFLMPLGGKKVSGELGKRVEVDYICNRKKNFGLYVDGIGGL